MSTNRRVRESPVDVADNLLGSLPPSSFKTGAGEGGCKATEKETTGRDPSQEIARQTEERDSAYTTRSHKYIASRRQLPDSQQRMDSREQIYTVLECGVGSAMSDTDTSPSGGFAAASTASITQPHVFDLYRRVQPTPFQGGEGGPPSPSKGGGVNPLLGGLPPRRGVEP